MCTYSRSWLAEPSEVSAAPITTKPRVEAGLAPAGDRVGAGRERANAPRVEQGDERQRPELEDG